MAWKRGKQWWTRIEWEDGTRRQVPLDTTSKSLKNEIERMLQILCERKEWALLRAVFVAKTQTLSQLFAAYSEGEHAVKALKAALDDVDLQQFVSAWQIWARRKAVASVVLDYTRKLRVLMPENTPFLRSQFTKKTLVTSLNNIPGSGPTAARHHTAWSSFANYLVDIEILEHNVLRQVTRPTEHQPRDNFLDLADVRRLVDAQHEPFRTLAAFREATGAEISAALRVCRRDVSNDAELVQVRGTKNEWRSRPVYVEPWARPYLLKHMRGLHPDALLFDFGDASPLAAAAQARTAHKAALKALKLPRDYRLHDARHSFAVRWMRAGIDPNLIAANLGHKDAALVLRVYGKHRPRAIDFEKLCNSFGHSSETPKKKSRASRP